MWREVFPSTVCRCLVHGDTEIFLRSERLCSAREVAEFNLAWKPEPQPPLSAPSLGPASTQPQRAAGRDLWVWNGERLHIPSVSCNTQHKVRPWWAHWGTWYVGSDALVGWVHIASAHAQVLHAATVQISPPPGPPQSEKSEHTPAFHSSEHIVSLRSLDFFSLSCVKLQIWAKCLVYVTCSL